jgi:site-specific DNA-methyltransferase (adenine-specific)
LEVGYNPKDIWRVTQIYNEEIENVWSVTRIHKEDPEREDHPTQKPLELMERIIKVSSPVNGIVLDPFMGSGTTAVACIKLNRSYVGFEINSNYCEIIKKRIEKIDNDIPLLINNKKS